MRPIQAITTCLRKAFQFSGRTSRTDFWWFAPLGFVPPVVTGLQLSWVNMDFWGIWRVAVLLVLSLPLLAAMSRRLQDIGEPAHEVIFPFMPFVGLWVGYRLAFWIAIGSATAGLAAVGLFLGWMAITLFIPLYLAAIFASLYLAASTIGKLLLPSTPGPNRYGPNPLEVTP